MFRYNNTHIFTGYLKQLLSSVNLPTCKIYTQEFTQYLEQHGCEDPRILRSFNNIGIDRLATRITYLKNNSLYYYLWNRDIADQEADLNKASWKKSAEVFYDGSKAIPGLTKTLNSSGSTYDTITHEYLGDYLRFLRDYHNINLMPLYNCFTDKIYNNIYFNFPINPNEQDLTKQIPVSFNAQEPGYRIYAIPVKLFAEYTIAIDSTQSIEMFCGLYNTTLDTSSKARRLAAKTYKKVNKAIFNQPFLYDKLTIANWPISDDIHDNSLYTNTFTHWDIAGRENDLRLFIKVPVSCKSSITILEGDYRTFNNSRYAPIIYKANGEVFNSKADTPSERHRTSWAYRQNHCAINFNNTKVNHDKQRNRGDGINLNNYTIKPISKLQLLAFNTGESYPFADRLVEYLSGSAITPLDDIPDNIKRTQRVMEQNKNYFAIEGIWENKMQNIIYDYMINTGPVELEDGKLRDKRQGYHKTLGHTNKSTLYDILGYVDKDAEKWYAHWVKDNGKAQIKNSIQNVDIYVDKNGKSLWDIK